MRVENVYVKRGGRGRLGWTRESCYDFRVRCDSQDRFEKVVQFVLLRDHERSFDDDTEHVKVAPALEVDGRHAKCPLRIQQEMT